MEQGHQDSQECFSIPEISSPPASPALGAGAHISRSGAEPFPLEETFPGAAGHPKGGQNAGTGFDTPSAQEEIFGPSSITSVSCSHWDLPGSPTIPEQTNLPKQMDPRSSFHGTSHIRHSQNHLSPHMCCQQTCWGPITPKPCQGHPSDLMEGSAPGSCLHLR